MSKLWKNLRRLRRMGCEQSLPDEHPRIFKGKSLNDKKKTVEWVTLEVKDDFIVVKGRNRKVIAKWPISCLQKYGYTNNIFLLETGTSCNGGKAVFLFKLDRANDLFGILKNYWNDAEIRRRQLLTTNPTLLTTVSVPGAAGPASNLNFTNGILPTTSNRYVDSNTEPQYVNDEAVPQSTNSTGIRPTPLTLSQLQDAELDYEVAEPVFALLPAPASRDEMMQRRNQSDMVAVFNSGLQSVAFSTNRRESDHHYENVHYDPTKQRVGFVRLSNDDVQSTSQLSRNRSLKSDTGPLLTPASNNTSGVGSMTSGSTSLPMRYKQPLDSWRYRMAALRTPPGILHPPHSARDYVNTANALSDVCGTPLPATTTNSFHFNFDFVNGSAPLSRNNSSKLNYVPVDPRKPRLDTMSCEAASSTSSGISGTPRSAKTPQKVERSRSRSIEYAIIDHHKTNALSLVQKKRQQETRHGSTGTES